MTHPPIYARALIFDMDGTLYCNARLDRAYEDSLARAVMERKGVTRAEAYRLFVAKQSEIAAEQGVQPSALHTLARLGVSDRIWAVRYGRIPCREYLRTDRRLRSALVELAQRHRLAVVTNNHRANTLATLEALGVRELFDEILTLSESRRFKPAPELYQHMAERLGVDPHECLSIGDRYDLDLEPAARVGMQTLWVRRPAEIYTLPRAVRPPAARRLSARTPVEARAAVRTAAGLLRAGRLVVVPTDTVYGLASAPKPETLRWLYRAKGRPETNPLVLLIADASAAERYANVTARARELMAQHWPGALTLILPVRPGAPWGRITRGGRNVALRVPAHDLLRRILRAAGGAAAVTSANCSGRPAPAAAARVDQKILAFSEAVVDTGPAIGGKPSTVAQLTRRGIRILRPGAVAPELRH